MQGRVLYNELYKRKDVDAAVAFWGCASDGRVKAALTSLSLYQIFVWDNRKSWLNLKLFQMVGIIFKKCQRLWISILFIFIVYRNVLKSISRNLPLIFTTHSSLSTSRQNYYTCRGESLVTNLEKNYMRENKVLWIPPSHKNQLYYDSSS